MINEKALLEFVEPYYIDKDIIQDKNLIFYGLNELYNN